MKDFLGKELSVGDEVVWIHPGYREYDKAKVLRFTKCYVIIERIRKYHDGQTTEEVKQKSEQLIKI